MRSPTARKALFALALFVIVIFALFYLIGASEDVATITSEDGLATLKVYPSSLPPEYTLEDISIQPLPNPGTGVVAAYNLEPDGLELAEPAVFTINMGAEKDLPHNDNGTPVVLLHHVHNDNAELMKRQNNTINTASGDLRVAAELNSFSAVVASVHHVHLTAWLEKNGEEEYALTTGGFTRPEFGENKFAVGDQFRAVIRTFYVGHPLEKDPHRYVPPDQIMEDIEYKLTFAPTGNLEVEYPTYKVTSGEKERYVSPETIEYEGGFEQKLSVGASTVEVFDSAWNKAGKWFTCEKPGDGNTITFEVNMQWEITEHWTLTNKRTGSVYKNESVQHASVGKEVILPVRCVAPDNSVEDGADSSDDKSEDNDDEHEAQNEPNKCAAVCGDAGYTDAQSLKQCSDTSAVFMCIQDKKACYDYLVPSGWNSDSGCCCRQAPIERYAGERIDCAAFAGWDINGFAVTDHVKYPAGEATLPPEQCAQ